MPTLHNNPTYYVGGTNVLVRALPPFDALARAYLSDLSSALREDAHAKQHSDLQTFAFWCRPSHFDQLKARYDDGTIRLGRGLIFHIAPSNVPINAAYSFAFGLIAGNANIVRVPSQKFVQLSILFDVMNRLFEQPRHADIKAMTAFIRYPHDPNITREFSSRCAARVIWGGDETVREIRKIPLPQRAVEIAFPDRYSLCVLNAKAVEKASDDEISRLAERFYNDTYLMDQNACSSPQLVLWQGKDSRARERFWQAVAVRVAAKYELLPVMAVDKYSMLLDAITEDIPIYVRRYKNQVYVAGVENLNDAETRLRGKFGLFYEKSFDNLTEIASVITPKTQTLTYFGFDKNTLRDFVVENCLPGIDRIVPIGSALDIDVIWDGFDIVRGLSRLVDVQ